MFDFLRLPREIREKIYDYVFVRERLDIYESLIAKKAECSQGHPKSFEYDSTVLDSSGEQFRESSSRNTWTICWQEDYRECSCIETKSYTGRPGYEHEPGHWDRIPPRCRITLELLLTNRQIYNEGRYVFNSKNIFTFIMWEANSDEAALYRAFMQDRLPQSWELIHHISFKFRDDDIRSIRCPKFDEMNKEIKNFEKPHTIDFDFFVTPLDRLSKNDSALQYCPRRVDEYFKCMSVQTFSIHMTSYESGHEIVILIQQLGTIWRGIPDSASKTEALSVTAVMNYMDEEFHRAKLIMTL